MDHPEETVERLLELLKWIGNHYAENSGNLDPSQIMPRIDAALAECEEAEEYGPPKPSGVYDLSGKFLRPFRDEDRDFIREKVYNGVIVRERG